MNRALFLLTGATLLSLSSTAIIPAQTSNCWDGTFAYQTATLNVEGGRIEIGATAGFALFDEVAKDFSDQSGLPLESGFYNQKIYAAFSDEQCQQRDEGTVACEATIGDPHRFLSDTVFVERYLRDLDSTITTITPVYLQSVKAEINPNKLKLELFDYDYQERKIVRKALIDIDTRICSEEGRVGNTHFGDAFFPERLRAYLAAFAQP